MTINFVHEKNVNFSCCWGFYRLPKLVFEVVLLVPRIIFCDIYLPLKQFFYGQHFRLFRVFICSQRTYVCSSEDNAQSKLMTPFWSGAKYGAGHLTRHLTSPLTRHPLPPSQYTDNVPPSLTNLVSLLLHGTTDLQHGASFTQGSFEFRHPGMSVNRGINTTAWHFLRVTWHSIRPFK